jgi:N-acetylmuramoyl-L-alanine amidase
LAMIGFLASSDAWAQDSRTVTATGLHISTSGLLTQVQIDLTGQIPFTAAVSDTRKAVIVSAKGLDFSLPTGAGKKAKGLVERVRYGKTADGQSEIAIDTNANVTVRKSYLAVANHSKRVRLTIVLGAIAEIPADSLEITGSLSPPALPAVLPQFSGGKPLIVIDPGHGGIDPGAVSASGTKEKDVVLAFAKALQLALLANGRVDVVLTRDGDTFLPLAARVDAARAKQADLFIAVHADTVNEHAVHGTTLYLLSDKASDAEAEALAQKENRADDIGGVDLKAQNSSIVDVLVNLTQRESKNRAAMFAASAVEQLRPDTAFTGQPLRSAGFVVLKAPDVPSVLVELGYLSNKGDEKNLLEEGWRTRVAEAFAAAVQIHFDHNETTAAQASP